MRQRANERFHYQSKAVVEAVGKRMRDYEMVLRSGAALFNASDDVSRGEWRAYSSDLNLSRYFPGIQGLGFSQVVASDQKEELIRKVRDEGFPEFTIWPPGVRDAYSAILYLEPFDWRNQRAFGYDMYSEATRRAAMDRASDSGEPALSGRVVLVQETNQDPQFGVLMYMPVYRSGMAVDTVEQRRTALFGFVYSPFRMKDLMRGILGADQTDLEFEIYDGGGPSPETLLYNNAGESVPRYRPQGGDDWLQAWHDISIAGRSWSIYLYAREAYLSPAEENQPLLVAAGGVTVDVLLFLVIASLSRRRSKAERLARRITAKLAASEERYRVLFERAMAPMLIIDPEKKAIVDANQAAADYYGYRREQLAAMSVDALDALPGGDEGPASVSGEPTDCREFSHRLSSGEIRRVEVRSGPIELNGRSLLYSIVIDVTQRWRLEAAKARQLSSLRALNEVEAIRDSAPVEQLRAALAIGCRLFGLEYGIVSHIDGARYEVISQSSPPTHCRMVRYFLSARPTAPSRSASPVCWPSRRWATRRTWATPATRPSNSKRILVRPFTSAAALGVR